MNLQNGKFYTTIDGTVVKAQLEADHKYHCYDAGGNEVTSLKTTSHVEGWMPCSAAKFAAARKLAKSKPKPSVGMSSLSKKAKGSKKDSD